MDFLTVGQIKNNIEQRYKTRKLEMDLGIFGLFLMMLVVTFADVLLVLCLLERYIDWNNWFVLLILITIGNVLAIIISIWQRKNLIINYQENKEYPLVSCYTIGVLVAKDEIVRVRIGTYIVNKNACLSYSCLFDGEWKRVDDDFCEVDVSSFLYLKSDETLIVYNNDFSEEDIKKENQLQSKQPKIIGY